VSLTGLPLLVVSVVGVLGSFALTIWSWSRGGWWRPIVRTAGVLACEALVLFTVGLVVNQQLEIFPSWSSLLNQDRKAPPPTVVADPTTKLDVWLHGRAVEGTHNGLVFEWKPADAASWQLAAAPVVYVPPRYFSLTTAHFPVVLVVAPAKAGPEQGAWDAHKVNLLVPRSDAEVPAVIVFLRTDHPDEAALTRAVPKMLDGDLRTITRGWAVIGIGTDAAVGSAALAADPLRFWSAVAIADNPPRTPGKPAAHLDWQAALSIVGADRPEVGRSGPAPANGPPTGAAPEPPPAVKVVTPPEARLPAALRWVYGRLPAPLAPPVAGPVDPNAPAPAAKAGQ